MFLSSAQHSAKEAAGAAGESAKLAENAVVTAKSMRLRATIIGGLTALALIAALVTMVFQIYGLVKQTSGLVQDASSYTQQNSLTLRDEIGPLEREVQDLKTKLDNVTKSMEQIPLLEKEIQKLQTQLDSLSQTTRVGKIETQE